MKVKEKSEKCGLRLNIQKTKIMASSPITSCQIDEETRKQCETFLCVCMGWGGSGSKITAGGDGSHEIKRQLLLGWKAMTNLDRILKSWDITLLTKIHLIKAMVFPVVMYGFTYRVGLYYTYIELNYKESWALKNWYFWAVVLEKILESPLDCKEIQPVHPKGNQSWIVIGRTDAESEVPILWPPDVKNWLIWKFPDAGKDQRQEEKGTTEDEMVGWHYRLNGHDFE